MALALGKIEDNNMRRIPRKRRGERNRFFQAEGVDEMLSCMLRLSAEVSALKDRLYIAEKVLEQQGLTMSSAIEAYQCSEAEEAELAVGRQRMIETILAQLDASPDVEDMTDENSTITEAA
jgi:hypothetical protein